MTSALFDTTTMGGVQLKNRFLMSAAAVTWNVTPENIPQDGDNLNLVYRI